jgi:uncharacterized protein
MADDEDDFDLDEDDAPTGESGVPAPTSIDDDDFDFDDDDDLFDEGGGGSKFGTMLAEKKKIILIALGVLLILGSAGGGAYWFFAGDSEKADASKGMSVSGAVGLALQEQSTTGLTPQAATSGTKLTAGNAQKLTAGTLVTGGGKLTAGNASTQGKLTASTAATVAGAVTGGMGGYDPDNKETPLSTAAVGEVGVNIPAVLPQVVASLGQPLAPQPLAPPDDQSLFEVTKTGLMPTISPEGKEPWKSYARPFSGDPAQPMIGLIVTGLGQSANLTQAAIDHLPADVTLSFSVYGFGVKEWVQKARAMGHEVLLELPLESDTFPVDDPGPMALMTSKTPSENLTLMGLLMTQAQGYIGFLGQYGTKFLRDDKAMNTVLSELKTRGLFFVDPRTVEGSVTLEMADQMQLPRAIADHTLNTNTSIQKVRAQFDTLATLAGNQGLTVALVPATPSSIKIIKEWAPALKNVQLAPITSLAGRQGS